VARRLTRQGGERAHPQADGTLCVTFGGWVRRHIRRRGTAD